MRGAASILPCAKHGGTARRGGGGALLGSGERQSETLCDWSIPMIYKIGSIGDFMKWTKRVVGDPAAATATPKRWFDSNTTAARALCATTSPEGMVKLSSEDGGVHGEEDCAGPGASDADENRGS